MNPVLFRQEFFSKLDSFQPFHDLLDLIPDVAFFMKDRRGRFIMNNRLSCEYARVASELETIGKTDYDFYPKDKADVYVAGDQRVMRSGVPIINEIAPAPEPEGSDKLIIYSKVPLKDKHGKIIGIAGIHRLIEGIHAHPQSYGRLSKAVQFIHKNHAQPLSTGQLAGMVGISRSQFVRRFRKLFGTSLRQYILRLKIDAACVLLANTDRVITDVALEAGFYDHSHFTRTFSKMMGTNPIAYRKHHQHSRQNL